jgi:hypothetical protein
MPTTVPRARSGASLVFDSVRNEVVMFGGGLLNDTWVWNGSDWTQRFPTTSPPVRNHQTIAFDASRGETVLFGGYQDALGVNMYNDTWVWKGTNWTQKFPTNSTSVRVDPGMTYSSHGVVLFAGLEQVGTGAHFTNDTWLWTAANWVQGLATSHSIDFQPNTPPFVPNPFPQPMNIGTPMMGTVDSLTTHRMDLLHSSDFWIFTSPGGETSIRLDVTGLGPGNDPNFNDLDLFCMARTVTSSLMPIED